MTKKITPDAVLAGGSIALPVPGGIIRMTYGGGLSVEPAAAPSVEQIAEALRTAWRDDYSVRSIAEAIHTLYGAPVSEGFTAEASEKLVADLCRIAVTDPSEGVQHALDVIRDRDESQRAEVQRLTALAENKQAVIDEDRADTKRNRELWAETAYANGEEITQLRAVVEAAEGRIDALLKVDAAVADLREAQADVEAAEEAIEVATDLDLEAAKALNAAKAKYAMQATTDPWAERDAEVPQ